jgi:two-component system response regulator YesN
MYKVFVVEDEVVLRKGIRQNVKWEDTNFTFTGDAADGEEALPLIREIRPDILITDIKMPFMDGLELSKIVKGEMPDTKIIVLTGYDEFDFAREALSIGVSEYLLKPFSSSKLLEVLDKAADGIKSEKVSKIRDYEKYVLEKNIVNNYDKEEAFSVNEMHKYDESFINDFIRLGTAEQIEAFLDEYLKRIGTDAVRSYLYTYYSFMNIVIISSKFIKELGGDINIVIPETKELENLCLNLDSIDDLRKYVKKVISFVIDFRDDKKLNKYADIIIESKDYIGKNYAKFDLSLSSVATYVNMSPNHFSMIFKQETGESFIEYLTNFRIKKAMEILQTSSRRSLEIAAAVGYSDPHYFSHLFKKMVNCTPTEFRNRS